MQLIYSYIFIRFIYYLNIYYAIHLYLPIYCSNIVNTLITFSALMMNNTNVVVPAEENATITDNLGEEPAPLRTTVTTPKSKEASILTFQFKTCKCPNDCKKITEEERKLIHTRFKNLRNWDARSAFLCASVHKASGTLQNLNNWMLKTLLNEIFFNIVFSSLYLYPIKYKNINIYKIPFTLKKIILFIN